VFIDAAIGKLRTQRFDQAGVPTGMHHAETPGVDKQRQLIEPALEIVPVAGMVFKLGQGFVQQTRMARRVFADELLAAARWRRGAPAQRVEFVVAHDAQGLPGLDHVVDDVQRLANARATVDDVADEHGHARWMPPDPALLVITEAVKQVFEGQGASVHVTNQVITARGIEHQSPPPPSLLPQPSLVRQTS
jgi:hypothetical protein